MTSLRTLMPCLLLMVASTPVAAQISVDAWHSHGQTFVVFEEDPSPPATYEIYRAAAPVADTALATFTGRIFPAEWGASRLKFADPTYEWRVPHPTLTEYLLGANEGAFVYTPHSAGDEVFFVVPEGTTTISASQTSPLVVQAASATPTCHLQHAQLLPGGYQAEVWTVWADGSDDDTSALPGFPILANAAKMGAPHVFAVYFMPGAVPPPDGFPVVTTLPGGSGNFTQMNPEGFANVGLELPDGLVVSHDDAVYRLNASGVAERYRSTWFGYVRNMDPFTPAPVNPDPNDPGSVAVPYTQRRLDWVADWLIHRSPYSVDEHRISLIGFSSGSRGAFMAARLYPDRYSSTTSLCPGFLIGGGMGNPMFGDEACNLPTNLLGHDGRVIRMPELFKPWIRVAPARDFPLMRLVFGRRDNTFVWDTTQVEGFRDCDAAGWGMHIYWDERDHTPPDWSVENNVPWPTKDDIGQWVVPPVAIGGDKTEKCTAAWQTRYRNDESYPGFFDEDQDPSLPGRQPDPGDGTDHCLGEPWGTWSGFCEWEQSTIVDLVDRWECTMFLSGLSTVPVDNALHAESKVSVTLRRTRAFLPAAGTELAWQLLEDGTGIVVKRGLAVAGPEGLVTIRGLLVPRDPDRVRLVVTMLPAPCLSGNVDTGPGGGGAPVDVLLVNGDGGGSERLVLLDANDPFTLEIVEPPSQLGAGASFWVGAWLRPPTAITTRSLPASLGTICMPLLVTGGVPQPRKIANNIPGSTAALGAETWPGPPTTAAPFLLLASPGGLGRPGATLYFQGIVRDGNAPGAYPYAVTNGVRVVVRD